MEPEQMRMLQHGNTVFISLQPVNPNYFNTNIHVHMYCHNEELKPEQRTQREAQTLTTGPKKEIQQKT